MMRFFVTFAMSLALFEPLGLARPSNLLNLEPVSPTARKVIYDTDLAMDDWFGLLYLMKSEQFELLGVTVAGNGEANCQFVQPVVSRLTQMAGDSSVPIRCGALDPFDGYFTFPWDWRKGANTLHGLVPYTDMEYHSLLGQPTMTLKREILLSSSSKTMTALKLSLLGL
ncbi:MAG: nucleoside hydrolase [Pseudomonadota bacterium]